MKNLQPPPSHTRRHTFDKQLFIRRNNWEDGVLVTGGYRDAGAWINTAWWLSMEALKNSSITTNKWQRLTNISPMFDGGRHNHQMTTAALR